MKYTIRQFVVGAIQTNCYFLSNEQKETLIIDPGAEPERLIREIRKADLKPAAILLTHAHWDHIDGCERVKEEFGIPVCISDRERETLRNPEINLSLDLGGTAKDYSDVPDHFIKDGEETTLSGFQFTCLSTPGHTPGGACWYFPAEKILFSGDSLFQYSVGRTDFPGGSMSDLVRALQAKVCVLPEDTNVRPGHGPATTVGNENRYNPYLQENL